MGVGVLEAKKPGEKHLLKGKKAKQKFGQSHGTREIKTVRGSARELRPLQMSQGFT